MATPHTPEQEILRVLRAAAEPMSRGRIYERTRIDDITDVDAGLDRLLAARQIAPCPGPEMQYRLD